ncbi:MAG: lipoprotein insertase outer membrane protein LolB [Pseudomonadota bacterium]|nr:lipoprotein insertase outer membrane protein LolB [Pseudomonadota bacterium]
MNDAAFTARGRLSARHGTDAVTASFNWVHAPPRDEVELSTPLGQMVATLSGDASVQHAEIRLADGRSMDANDWPALTQRALGFPLPVEGLAAWIRGAPRPGSPFQAETDERARATLLRQDGWEIVLDYADANASTPVRLRMTYPEVELRLVLDAFAP